MQNRFEKFDSALKKIKAQKKSFENPMLPVFGFFAPEGEQNFKTENTQKANELKECIVGFQDYRRKIEELSSQDSKNINFYNAHFDAIVEKLQKVGCLKAEDFKPKALENDVEYHRTPDDIRANTRIAAFHGIGFGLLVGAVISVAIVMTLIFTLSPMVLFPTVGIGLCIMLGTEFGGAIFGGLVGALIGALVGHSDPFDCFKRPSDSQELNFVLPHLEKANGLLSTAIKAKANDEEFEDEKNENPLSA